MWRGGDVLRVLPRHTVGVRSFKILMGMQLMWLSPEARRPSSFHLAFICLRSNKDRKSRETAETKRKGIRSKRQ